MDHITATLITAIRKPIALGPKYERPLDYIAREQPDYASEYGIYDHLHPPVQKLIDYFKRILGWLKANPSEPDLPDAMRYLYIIPHPDIGGTEAHNIANLGENFKLFWESLTDFSQAALREEVYIIGKKGTGKTFFLNYILNCYSDSLRDNLGIMWYRVDGSKVYQLNVDLKPFLYQHVLFVSLKHPNSCPHLRAVVDGADEFLQVLEDGVCVKLGSGHEILRKYRLLVQNAEKLEDLLAYTVARVEIEHFGNSILRYLRSRAVKLLFIFDGIDNIDYYRDREKYDRLLDQLAQFGALGIEKVASYDSKILLAVRDETFAHLRRFQTFGRPKIFRIKSLGVRDVVGEKVKKATSDPPRYFRNIRDTAKLQFEGYEPYQRANISHKDFEDKFERFASDLPDRLCKELQRFNLSLPLTPENILVRLYNENVRAFIDNLLNVYEYSLLFEEKKGLVGRPYVLLEGLFLNGSLFVNSVSSRQKQEGFINLFYYSNPSLSETWHGLCGIRILQLLGEGPHKKEVIASILKDMFAYEENVIEEFVQRYVEGGLIEPVVPPADGEIQYHLLPKGRFLLQYSCADVNFLYHCAVDTPLTYRLLGKSSCLQVHVKFWQEYTESAIKTAITLIRHVRTQFQRDLDKSGPAREASFRNRRISEVFEQQILPSDGMLKQMAAMVQSLGSSRQENLLKDINGL